MTKKSLQDWYSDGNISYSEKESLNKIGINDYNYHYLQDLKQILNCENWAKNSSEIRSKLAGFFGFFGRIKKITFFTPNFNDSKTDASNYSCAIVTDGIGDNWVIVYRPSYVRNIQNDVFIHKIEKGVLATEIEDQLNGDHPVLAMVSSLRSDTLDKPFVRVWSLPSDAKYNPNKYLLPFDIVKRESAIMGFHFAIYLGNSYVAHLTGEEGEGTVFEIWYKFCNPNSGSSSSSDSSSSSSAFSPFLSLSFSRAVLVQVVHQVI